MTDEGRYTTQIAYDNILQEQVIISYMSKGSVTIADTDLMSPYDRKIIYDSLVKIKEEEAKVFNDSTNKQK